MSLIIATGANLGDRGRNLALAKNALSEHFELVAESRVYSSPAVGYEAQPEFYNQVLEFNIPNISPHEVIQKLLALEAKMGRRRVEKWGPRQIDLDIIFWGMEQINLPGLQVPHPRWHERAFVVLPLRELPFFQELEKSFNIPQVFDHHAEIVSESNKKGRQ